MSFHITANGPKLCSASVGSCPYGGEHFDSMKEARVEHERALEKQFENLEKIIENKSLTLPILNDEKTKRILDGLTFSSLENGATLSLRDVLRNPHRARGNCAPATLAVGDALMEINSKLPVHEQFKDVKAISVEFEQGDFHNAVLIESAHGEEIVIDYTASQWNVKVSSREPLVLTKSDWLAWTESASGLKVKEVELF